MYNIIDIINKLNMKTKIILERDDANTNLDNRTCSQASFNE